MAASLELSSSGRFGVRNSSSGSLGLPFCFPTIAPHDTSPKPRAQPGACEGLKRTTSGSEPDKLPPGRGEVLNKTAAFYGPEGAGASTGQAYGRSEKLLSCPDDK